MSILRKQGQGLILDTILDVLFEAPRDADALKYHTGFIDVTNDLEYETQFYEEQAHGQAQAQRP